MLNSDFDETLSVDEIRRTFAEGSGQNDQLTEAMETLKEAIPALATTTGNNTIPVQVGSRSSRDVFWNNTLPIPTFLPT